MKRQLAVETICFLFILLFVYAGVSKFLDLEKFSVQIGQSPLLTDLAGFVSWFIPGIEVVVAIMLAIPKVRTLGLYAAFGLMVMFTAYIIAILNFSEHIPCSCGGVLENLGWTEHLVFNIGFIVMALAGISINANANVKRTSAV